MTDRRRERKAKAPEDPVVREIRELKLLFLLALVKWGTSQDEIAAALGVNQSTVSRMMVDFRARPKE